MIFLSDNWKVLPLYFNNKIIKISCNDLKNGISHPYFGDTTDSDFLITEDNGKTVYSSVENMLTKEFPLKATAVKKYCAKKYTWYTKEELQKYSPNSNIDSPDMIRRCLAIMFNGENLKYPLLVSFATKEYKTPNFTVKISPDKKLSVYYKDSLIATYINMVQDNDKSYYYTHDDSHGTIRHTLKNLWICTEIAKRELQYTIESELLDYFNNNLYPRLDYNRYCPAESFNNNQVIQFLDKKLYTSSRNKVRISSPVINVSIKVPKIISAKNIPTICGPKKPFNMTWIYGIVNNQLTKKLSDSMSIKDIKILADDIFNTVSSKIDFNNYFDGYDITGREVPLCEVCFESKVKTAIREQINYKFLKLLRA